MATGSTTPSELSSPEQVHVLQCLKQQSAAFLAGVSARTLRDHPQIPRHRDGSYDGRQIVKWVKTRVAMDDVDETILERILVAIEQIPQDCKAPYVELVDDLIDEYGDLGYGYLGRVLAEMWRESYSFDRDDKYCRPPSDKELNGLNESERRILIEQRARFGLRIKAVCERCGNVRHGRKWSTANVPEGFATIGDLCPRCVKRT